MTDLEQHYLNKEKEKLDTIESMRVEVDQASKELFQQIVPCLLKRFKKNPPVIYEWKIINNKKCLGWPFRPVINYSSDSQIYDRSYWFLLENGDIYKYEDDLCSPVDISSNSLEGVSRALFNFAEENQLPKHKLKKWHQKMWPGLPYRH